MQNAGDLGAHGFLAKLAKDWKGLKKSILPSMCINRLVLKAPLRSSKRFFRETVAIFSAMLASFCVASAGLRMPPAHLSWHAQHLVNKNLAKSQSVIAMWPHAYAALCALCVLWILSSARGANFDIAHPTFCGLRAGCLLAGLSGGLSKRSCRNIFYRETFRRDVV